MSVENSPNCDRCGTANDPTALVARPETGQAVCRSCHQEWTIPEWEHHIHDTLANYKAKRRSALDDRTPHITTTKVGGAMTGIERVYVTFIGLDKVGRPLISRPDQGGQVDVLVPLYEGRAFRREQRELRERYENSRRIPIYKQPGPRHGPSGFDPITTPNKDLLVSYDTHPLGNAEALTDWLLDNATDFQALSSFALGRLDASILDGTDDLVDQHVDQAFPKAGSHPFDE